MKRADKLVLFLISLICLVFSIGILSFFYPLPYVSDVVNEFYGEYYWLNYIIVGFCAFICLLFLSLLLLSVFIPRKSNNLVFPKSKGSLKFSKQAIESTVKCSFADVSGINLSQVKAKIHKQPEKLRIYVKLSVSDISELVELTETVQARIESALQSSLGITAKAINVKVANYNQNNKVQAENSDDLPTESRVV